MRLPLITVALFFGAASTPAFAQAAGEAPMAAVAEALEDPATQDQVALTAAALVGVLMELPVGTLAQAASEATGEGGPAIDPDARVRDLVGMEGRDAPQQVAQRLPEMMTALAGMAGALQGMLPQLRELADRLPEMLPETLSAERAE
ncbi:hypothetical protein [Aurantiacibacter marinus]|uniref:DUF2780 domain-containing protein n=1 Tax=Aurantiacibacter marinus TaxID=874156 RepID=A0A0H0XSN3_9SPHN|nr:hypothetical protein [Aurantiacibacter marinus]KLI64957.1 hypothetical protein AAV99_05570 [Aurantiacibacter marinus]